MTEKIRLRVRFFGRVQGVGFRYTAHYVARSLGLTGWVYNDDDGSVLMEIQGNGASVKKMIERLDSDRHIQIERMEKSSVPLDEYERSFNVKY